MGLVDVFFICTLAAAFVIALILGLGTVVRQALSQIGIKRVQQIAELTFDKARFDFDTVGRELISYYQEVTGSHKHKMLDLWGLWSTDHLLRVIKNRYTEVEEMVQWCNLDRTNCSTIIRFKGGNGDVYVVKLVSFHKEYLDPKTRPTFQNNDRFSIESVLRNGALAVNPQISLLYGAELKEDDAVLIQLLADFDEASIEEIKYPNDKTNRVWLNRLQIRPYGGLELEEYSMMRRTASEEYFNDAYNPVSIEFNGQDYDIDMDKAIEIGAFSLSKGNNLYIFGSPGTGKTSLMELIQLTLQDYETTSIVNISTEMLEELQGIGGEQNIRKALQENIEQGLRTIFVIDEAERVMTSDSQGIHSKESSFVLRLLDGSLQRELNCATVLVFNARPEQLNSALFRKGRVGMQFELKPLKRNRALNLVKYLKEALPDRIFDQGQFERILEQCNQLPGRLDHYAGVGEITLGDVWSCFVEADSRALIVQKLREQAGIELPKKKQEVVAPRPSVTSNGVDAKISELQASYVKDKRRKNSPGLAAVPTIVEPSAAPTRSSTPIRDRRRNRGKKKNR